MSESQPFNEELKAAIDDAKSEVAFLRSLDAQAVPA
jgi:hypothetical protein